MNIIIITGASSGIGMEFARQMAKKGGGSVVNFASMNSYCPLTRCFAYAMSKAAVENFTKSFAAYFAAAGVRVNAIAPGAIATPIWDVPGITKEEAEAHQKHIASGIPMGYVGEPQDIANMALYLVTDEARYIDGATIAIDGAMGAI